MSQLEVAKGEALTQYRNAKKELGKKADPDAARLLDDTHAIALDYLDRMHDPNRVSDTVRDLTQLLVDHPEEAALTEEDVAALETLPAAIRTRLKELLHLPAA